MFDFLFLEQRISATLEALYGPQNFNITTLKSAWKNTGQGVFLCQSTRSDLEVICKIGDQDERAREKMKRQFHALQYAYRIMRGSLFLTPEPIAFDEDANVLVMSYVKGDLFKNLVREDRSLEARIVGIERAVRWINRYHARTRYEMPFQAVKHFRWLRRSNQAQRNGRIKIKNYGEFRPRFRIVREIWSDIEGLPNQRAVIHHDYHTANLVMGSHGETYAIDFERLSDDDCLRDFFSLFFDYFATRIGLDEEIANFQPEIDAFMRYFDFDGIAPEVIGYYQLVFALDIWKNYEMDMDLQERHERRLRVAKHFASHALLPQTQEIFDITSGA